MSYMALYRKWRPLLFEDVVGQEHVTQTLKNEIQSNRVSHAYLFSGTRGTGKTSTAKIFSRAVNCLHPKNGNPCNECEHCAGILNNTILDVSEIDAASNNSVDDIRALRDDVNYSPSGLKYKIYIIDEVHMLSTSAFNALLKTLEEPPQNVIFILATTEIHKIPVTILSRCQRFDFKRIDAFHIKQRLSYIVQREKIPLQDDALLLLARAADGSMRDALSILDQCISMNPENITRQELLKVIGSVDISHLFRLTDAIAAQNVERALAESDSFIQEGRDLLKLSADLISHLRNLLICKTAQNCEDLVDFGFEYLGEYQSSCVQFSMDSLIYLIQLFSKAQAEMKYAASKRVVLEIAFIKACRPEVSYDLEGLMARLDVLEGKLSGILSSEAAMRNQKTVTDASRPVNSVQAVSQNSNVVQAQADHSSKPAAVQVEQQEPPWPPSTKQPVQAESSGEPAIRAEDNGFDAEFELRDWAEIKAKVSDPGASSILFMAQPKRYGNCLYLLFDDSSFLDILMASNGEIAVRDAAQLVCGQELMVKAMLKSQFIPPEPKAEGADVVPVLESQDVQEIQMDSEPDAEKATELPLEEIVSAESTEADPFDMLLKKAQSLGNKTKIF